MISTACPSHPVYHLALPFLWLPPAVGIRNRRHFKLVPGSDSGLARIGLGPECSDSDFLSFLTCRILPAAASDTHHQSRELTSRRRVDCVCFICSLSAFCARDISSLNRAEFPLAPADHDIQGCSPGMSSSLIIDDNDPSVQYTPLWDLAEGPGYGRSYNLTLHSVRDAGQSVAVAFRGTGIQVVIMREPTSVAGYPVTVYYIDGTYIASIDTPFVPDGRSQSNVTVFTKRDLTQGAHVLNITNMNGTRPSTFWLDYFLVDASSAALNPSSSSTSSSTGMPAATSTSESGTAPSERIAAIAGGVAGALVVIIAAVLGCLWRRRRRRVRKERMLRTNVQPYVPVVRIISQYRTSLHSLEKIPPSPVEGTQSPSVSTPDVRTPRADTDGSRAPSGGALALDTPRSKGESSPLATSITPTPSTADLPRSPVPLLVAEHRHSVRMAAEEAPLRPASGLVLPDELGRALSAASPEVRSGIISFMHSLLQGGPGQQRSGAGGPAGEVDSGMRMYDDDYVPPPQYTTQ